MEEERRGIWRGTWRRREGGAWRGDTEEERREDMEGGHGGGEKGGHGGGTRRRREGGTWREREEGEGGRRRHNRVRVSTHEVEREHVPMVYTVELIVKIYPHFLQMYSN